MMPPSLLGAAFGTGGGGLVVPSELAIANCASRLRMRSSRSLLRSASSWWDSPGSTTGEPYELGRVVVERWVEVGDTPTKDACVLELLGTLRTRFGNPVEDCLGKEAGGKAPRVRRDTAGRIGL